MDSQYKRLLSPSLALLTLAALTPSAHVVWIEDENSGGLTLDDAPEVVGITVNVDTSTRAYEIARHYREKGVMVVLGGIHPSANPQEALQHADVVCIGEAEELWESILADFAGGRLQTLYQNDSPVDLKKIPVPSWASLDASKYLYTNIVYTSRGCPFTCEFCYNSCEYMCSPYRNRPIENIIEEINLLNTKHVMFIDDNFIGNPAWTRTFIRSITPLGLTWNAAVSANIVAHPDLLDEMKASGCRSLFIGFETINKDSVASVKKHQSNVALYEKLVHELHRRGIMINASIVFGFDHDSKHVFKDTLDWLVRNKVESVTTHILTPYPGTGLYDRFNDEQRIIDYNWASYNTAHVVFQPMHMTPDELYGGYLWLYKELYTIKNIIKRLPDDKRQWASYLLFNLVYRKFGRATSKLTLFTSMNSIGRIARRLSYGIG